MFKLQPNTINKKIFNIKEVYSTEDSYQFELILHNNISKTGFTTLITDINPWISGKTNISSLQIKEKEVFNSGYSYYINSFTNQNHIYNNKIKISDIEYQFTNNSSITYTQSVLLNDNYIICFNDENEGKIVVVDASGNTLTGVTFSSNPVKHINLHSTNTDSIIIGYFDVSQGLSFVKEINITTLTQYSPTLLYNGESNYLHIEKIDDIRYICTYHDNNNIGKIQLIKKSSDHIFSVGYPFTFNNNTTIYSNCVYQNNNVVVIYYDIDTQLKVKNIRLYDDYNFGIGLPTIITPNYCSDVNIDKLDNNYVYCAYYNISERLIENVILRIDNDTISIGTIQTIDDWNEGLNLKTIDNQHYIISYMDIDFNGVYRICDFVPVPYSTTKCEYNEFDIDLTHIDTSDNIGHNEYIIKYNNEIVETGICYIQSDNYTYNI
jgi:hypothetical protein